MQIPKIGAGFNLVRNFQPKKLNKFKNQTDTFEKSNNINFTSNSGNDVIRYNVDWGYRKLTLPDAIQYAKFYPKQNKLNILKGNERHLNNVAESLCMHSNKDIVNFTKIYRPFSKEVDEEKSIEAYAKIMPYIIQLREKLANLYQKKAELDLKALLGELSIKDNEDFTLCDVNAEIERINLKNIKAESAYLKTHYIKVNNKAYND